MASRFVLAAAIAFLAGGTAAAQDDGYGGPDPYALPPGYSGEYGPAYADDRGPPADDYRGVDGGGGYTPESDDRYEADRGDAGGYAGGASAERYVDRGYVTGGGYVAGGGYYNSGTRAEVSDSSYERRTYSERTSGSAYGGGSYGYSSGSSAGAGYGYSSGSSYGGERSTGGGYSYEERGGYASSAPRFGYQRRVYLFEEVSGSVEYAEAERREWELRRRWDSEVDGDIRLRSDFFQGGLVGGVEGGPPVAGGGGGGAYVSVTASAGAYARASAFAGARGGRRGGHRGGGCGCR